MMKPIRQINSLLSVLELEKRKGFTNKAVIGGLDKYILRWSSDTAGNITSPDITEKISTIVSSSQYYNDWDIEKRSIWVSDIIGWINRVNKTDKTAVTYHNKPGPAIKKIDPVNITRFSLTLDSPVTEIKGIKTHLAGKLSKLGISKIRDLVYHFPRYHIDYSKKTSIADLPMNNFEDMEMGPETVVVNIWESNIINLGHRGMKATEAVFGDDTGNASAIWFNQPYLAKQMPVNARVVISGKYKVYKGKITFQSPDWDIYDEEKDSVHAGRLVPVYALTAGLYQRQIRNLIKRTVDIWANKITEYLPQDIQQKCSLLNISRAIKQAHFPENNELKVKAQQRLAFDELFIIQMGMLRKKQSWKEDQTSFSIKLDHRVLSHLLSCLPYRLTDAQEKALSEILNDLKQNRAMSRLLQGDVGSGKTIVALISILAAADSTFQSAMMAPTEILAEQHFNNISQILSTLSDKTENNGYINTYHGIFKQPVSIALLKGKMTEKEKAFIYQSINNGTIDIAIGTHALIQKGLSFKKLGLVVIDEQHRFGVLQRNELRQKGFNPHVLVMTATPIPRTLALTLYGDLDISIISELPPGRQIIKTRWLMPEQRDSAYNFIRKQVSDGHQSFIICPLIEESENLEVKAAVAEFERLSQDIFPDLRMGLLHGRMNSNEKDEIMSSFRANSFDILVSTPVVEVGIDIPNATVILIEAANRFGLSQLHQFRGRVGRGDSQSYCILLADNPSLEARERLKIIENTQNGFDLAEKDLELRGPGEFFGTKQSGLPDLRMAKLTDVVLLEMARKEAQILFQDDPSLKKPENRLLALEISRIWPSFEWS